MYDANYYSAVLAKVDQAIGDNARVIAYDNREDYTIVATFRFPWSDPIGMDEYFNKVRKLADEGTVRLIVENGSRNEILARITVRFKKGNGNEI